MRHLQNLMTFLLLMVSLSFAKAQTSENSLMTSEFNDRVKPALDFSEMTSTDPSFFSRLRKEISKVELEEAKKNQGEGTAHVLRHVRTNFAPDSITFAIAGGLVYFTQLQLVTKSDPALMVKHIEALKDPIAHISFGAFMVANGIYIDMRTRGLDPMTKQLVMKTLTYKGLAVGSFASSLTADLLMTMKECTASWLNNKNDSSSHAACDYAFRQWTVRNKFVQYAPQILSLLAAQKVSSAVESLAHAGGRFLKPGVKSLESSTVKFFKLSSANIDLLFVGGGWTVKGIRWLGKLTKFTVFLAVDHVVAPHISRIGNDLIQPLFFDFDALAINKYMYNGVKNKWSSDKAIHAGDDFNKLPKEIFNFTDRMAAWRMHLNAKAEADLAGWLDASSKILHQIDYSKNYYLKYLENLYDTLNRQHLVNLGEFKDAPERAWALERRYPFRPLPLYGIKSGYNYGSTPENDIYLTKPYDIEARQSEFVKNTAISFYATLETTNGLSGSDLAKVKELLKPLTTMTIPYQQGIAVENILKFYLKIPPAPPMTQNGYTPEDTNEALRLTIKEFITALGNPKPQLKEGSGFNMAFDTYTTNYQEAQEAAFDLKDQNYKFAKASDLMLYQMICGNTKADIKEETFGGINFIPPRIVNTKDSLELCKNTWIFKNVKTDSIHDWKIVDNGKTFENPTRYIVNNINPVLLGNWKNIDKADKGQGFDKWWLTSILPTLQNQLKQLDKRYAQVVETANKQINDQKGFIDWAVDNTFNQSIYLDRNIGDNLRFEFEVYYTILKSILLDDQIKSTKWTLLADVHKQSLAKRFDIPYVSPSKSAQNLVNNNKWVFNLLKEINPDEITNLDDFSDKVLIPLRESFNSLKGNKSVSQTDLNVLEKRISKLTKELNTIRLIELEMNYKNFLSLLSKTSLKFDEMLSVKEQLFKSNNIVLGGFKQMAEAMGADNLPAEIQTILAVANGLEALEIETNRYLLMKVKLNDRLEIDMSQLNTFLKHRSLAPVQKQGATPYSVGG